MEAFDDLNSTHTTYNLNPADDWLRRRQGLALPILPPTTPEARRFFFVEIARYAIAASDQGKKTIDYSAFARDWNRSADGRSRFYVTPEVLMAYAKTWEKNTNIRASQDLIAEALDVISQTSQVFAAPEQSFPNFLTAPPSLKHPAAGLLEDTSNSAMLPLSLSTDLALSRPKVITPIPQPSPNSLPNSLISFLGANSNSARATPMDTEMETVREVEQDVPHSLRVTPAVSTPSNLNESPAPERPLKRRRVVPDNKRKRSGLRSCRRCHQTECLGSYDILRCPLPCRVACIKCGQTTGCRGVDKGRGCTSKR